MTEPVLDIADLGVVLHRDRQASLVLDHVSLSLAAGEILALVGESGSGKSTVGLAVQGLLPAEAEPVVTGSIRLDGTELVGAPERALRRVRHDLVRAIPQDPMGALNPTMRIGRQMREAARDATEIESWLQRVGLPDPRRILRSFPHALSGGQRQRVLIAMAMSAHPRLVIADEPTTALDVTIQAQILELLRKLAREAGTAVIFITHDLGVAASLADRIVVLYGGRVVETGPVAGVLNQPAHPYSAGLLATRFDFGSDRNRPLSTLPAGDAPPARNATHCVYAGRCPVTQPVCRSERPALATVPMHPGAAACFFPGSANALIAGAAETAAWPPANPVDAPPALRLEGVAKSFGALRVVENVDLTLAAGESVALVGESGSGKSTILRLAAGLLKPDRGSVHRADALPQVVFQDSVASLTPWLRVGDQIAERLRPLRLPRRERDARVRAALELVGLEPSVATALPSELSGGQCQRVAVARAVVVPPKLLLCDEPISAMDVSLAAQTLNLLGDLRRRLGMAMLFVTHDLAAARLIADRIVVLKSGRFVDDGDPDALIASPRDAYTRELFAAMPRVRERAAA